MRNRKTSLIRIRAIVGSASFAVAALALGSSSSLAAADATAGQQVFASRCGACHATEPGVSKIGPSLAGVFGRKSGSEAGFDYSPALKSAAIVWDEKTLDQFLQNPGADVHGTKMFVNMPGDDDRQNVVAYLKTLNPDRAKESVHGGLGTDANPHPIQQAFIAEQAAQCGYCIYGMLMQSAALLKRNPKPTEEQRSLRGV